MKNRFSVLLGLLLTCALVAWAGVADGTWTAAGGTSQGIPQTLSLQSNGPVLIGTADGLQITNGKVEGTSIWFNVARAGVTYNYKGTISGNQLSLHETTNGANHRALTFNRN